MRLDALLLFWSHAGLKIGDVRRVRLEAGERRGDYRLPSNAFLVCVSGTAVARLNGNAHDCRGGYVLHGIKGMRLQIEAIESFEHFLLLYRAFLPGSVAKALARIADPDDPLAFPYGFQSADPLPLIRGAEEIDRAWASGDRLGRIRAKGDFFRFLHDVLAQLAAKGESGRHPDPVAQAIRYLREHYRDGVSLESLAERLNYSSGHLAARFKERTGTSPMDYLIGLRLGRAIELLGGTDATLREIAGEAGYSDVYYFGRLFKKHVGLSPIQYRTRVRRGELSGNCPFRTSDLSIGGFESLRYDLEDNDNHYQNRSTGGSYRMIGKTKPGLAASLLLSLTLLLAACSGGGGSTNRGATETGASPANSAAQSVATSPSAASSAQASAPAETPKTRTISTLKGEVEVPAEPKRVVVLYLQGDVVTLGVKPVGTSDVYEGAAYEKELEGVQQLGIYFEPNPEAVMALNPDLIIVPTEETYGILNKVAPTILIPFDGKMEDRLGFLAQVFGKEEEVKQKISDFQAKVEASKEKLREAGVLDKTVSIMEGGQKTMTVVMSPYFGRGSQILYQYLGMKAPAPVQAKVEVATEGNGEEVSMEKLEDYSGDIIFRSSWEGMDDLADNKVWNSIPAVKNGNVVEIEFGFSYYNDLYSLDKQLDFIVERLLAFSDKA